MTGQAWSLGSFSRRLISMENARKQDLSRLFIQATKHFTGTPTIEKQRVGLELLKRAAAMGHIESHVWLGAAYDYGIGMRPNRRRALAHYRVAAEAGNPN